MVMTGGAGGGRRVRALVTWKRTAWKYNTNVRKKWIHSEHIILKIYVTAAVSGTEYSGELAASDLLVTFAFVMAIG